MWKIIDDEDVRHWWECKESVTCQYKQCVHPESYQEVGNPVCPQCDVEMYYSHTEYQVP